MVIAELVMDEKWVINIRNSVEIELLYIFDEALKY
jgi:hypothetical protein